MVLISEWIYSKSYLHKRYPIYLKPACSLCPLIDSTCLASSMRIVGPSVNPSFLHVILLNPWLQRQYSSFTLRWYLVGKTGLRGVSTHGYFYHERLYIPVAIARIRQRVRQSFVIMARNVLFGRSRLRDDAQPWRSAIPKSELSIWGVGTWNRETKSGLYPSVSVNLAPRSSSNQALSRAFKHLSFKLNRRWISCFKVWVARSISTRVRPIIWEY